MRKANLLFLTVSITLFHFPTFLTCSLVDKIQLTLDDSRLRKHDAKTSRHQFIFQKKQSQMHTKQNMDTQSYHSVFKCQELE